MGEFDKKLTHANCGGAVRRDQQKNHYVCDRCHAEAAGVVSAGAKIQGESEEVVLCNPHDDNF